MFPHIKVPIFSAYDDGRYLSEALGAGSAGFVLKRSAVATLIHAVRRVAAGGRYVDPDLVQRLHTSP